MSEVIYNGCSNINGAPIVALMTGGFGEKPSANKKTGPIPQVVIVAQSDKPHVARAKGDNVAVCGGCPLMEVCYVEVAKGPNSAWKRWKRGGSRPFKARRYSMIRIGAYGDPAAVPLQVWSDLKSATGARIIGYTHQWRNCDPGYARFAMASVETLAGKAEANARGFRTFRVMQPGEALVDGEILCPASAEGGNRRQCIDCQACDGTARSFNRPDVAIYQHK